MGVWLGHARSTNLALVATDEGIIKALGIRWLPESQQWDGERIRSIKGSPTNWKLDAGEDVQQVELDDGGILDGEMEVHVQKGSRTGERRSMYLRRSDFERYGFSDGCPGCRDMVCLLYTSPSPRDKRQSRMPSSA